MLLIKNAYLVSCADVNYENCDILVSDGKIVEISKSIENNNYTVIDAKNNYVTPGFVDPHCHIGIGEEGIGFEGRDYNEMTDPVTPHLRAIDAINPEDMSFREAVIGGVTTVVTGPGSANAIGGTFAAIKTHGLVVDRMVVKAEAAMKMAFGENPKRVYDSKSKTPMTRMATAALIRESLQKAKDYREKIISYENGKGEKPAFDQKLHSLMRVFDGLMVKMHAHRADDILTAMRIKEEFNLNATIDHCTEGHIIVNELKERNQRVIIGPLFSTRSKYELKNKTYKIASILDQNDVEFAIMTDHPVIPLADTRVQTAILIREGLNELSALKGMTINAARLNGIEDRVGSIEIGKDADIVIWNGNPFEYMTTTNTVIIDGNIVYQREE